MGQRGRGEGSIVKRSDGRWQGAVHDLHGRRRFYYGKTRAEVAAMVAKAIRERDQGLAHVPATQNVEAYLTSWLQTQRPPVLRESTWLRYRLFVEHDILPSLGRISLIRLSAQQVSALYAERLASGQSGTTVRHLHMVLHRALGQAVRLGLLQRNVCDLVDPPRARRVEMQTWTREEAEVFLATALHAREEGRDRLYALYVLAVRLGMRQGELLGLRWRQVDRRRGTLRVVSTLTWHEDGTWSLGEPKSEAGRREIPLSAELVSVLHEHHQGQAAERVRAGPVWRDHDLVFPNTIGNPLRKSNLLKLSYLRLVAESGVPRIRFHDLRHTAATLMLESGVEPQVVKEILGHSSIAVTLGIYAHVRARQKREAVERLDGLTGRS